MKKFLVLSLVAGVSFTAGRMFEGFSKTATAKSGQGGGGEEKCAAKNGDVNADGTVDLSDGVTILGYLFLGSPTELAPLCQVEAPLVALPATGQTWCYESGGKVLCNETTCGGQDGLYQLGCPSSGRLVDNLDGTVTDNCTALMWQKVTAPGNYAWCNALSYCEHLNFAGHDDWRLPNIRELLSIVDYGREISSIDPIFDALTTYWSSTSSTDIQGSAWSVDFEVGGGSSVNRKEFITSVRAVRNAP